MSEAPIVIVGGGAVGSAIAYFLKRQAPGQDVVVIERDPSYATASSALSASSIRQQFSTPVNIAISRFGIEFLRDLGTFLGREGEAEPDAGLTERGYLYLASAAGETVLRDNHAVQRAHGVDVALLTPDALRQRYPWLNTDDLALASLGGSAEGWFDGYLLLQALRAKAIALGARYLKAEAIGAVCDTHDGVRHVQALQLADGSTLPCTALVNAAGPWARRVAEWLGVDLPVYARRRTVFQLSSPAVLDDCPLLIDPSGIWLRPEGTGYLCGFCPSPQNDADNLPLEPEHTAFEEHVWPTLAERIPGFEALRVHSAWAGYYEMNTFDHNALIGQHTACDNAWFANGFSGHGLQQCPAVGRGVAELMLTGRFQTLDLGDLGLARLHSGQPLIERCVI